MARTRRKKSTTTNTTKNKNKNNKNKNKVNVIVKVNAGGGSGGGGGGGAGGSGAGGGMYDIYHHPQQPISSSNNNNNNNDGVVLRGIHDDVKGLYDFVDLSSRHKTDTNMHREHMSAVDDLLNRKFNEFSHFVAENEMRNVGRTNALQASLDSIHHLIPHREEIMREANNMSTTGTNTEKYNMTDPRDWASVGTMTNVPLLLSKGVGSEPTGVSSLGTMTTVQNIGIRRPRPIRSSSSTSSSTSTLALVPRGGGGGGIEMVDSMFNPLFEDVTYDRLASSSSSSSSPQKRQRYTIDPMYRHLLENQVSIMSPETTMALALRDVPDSTLATVSTSTRKKRSSSSRSKK